MDFPTIKNPSYPLTETHRDLSVKGTMENITIVARKRVTRVPRIFELTWSMLPNDDFIQLRDFYQKTNGADIFYWTHPITNERIRVRFSGDFSFQYKQHGYWTGGVKLEEV